MAGMSFSMRKVSDLPNELLRYLFKMLSIEDRLVAVLVSQRWRKVGEDPIFWKWCFINISNGNDIKKLLVDRFKYVEEIYVDSDFQWKAYQLEELFRATLGLPKLKEIDQVQKLDLRGVTSDLLGTALGKLEIVWLNGSQCTTNHQRVAILNEMSKNNNIKFLKISRINLKTLELDAGILGKIVSGLQSLHLIVSLTSDQQVLEIFKSINENNQLSTVYFGLNVSAVEPEIFGMAMAKIDEVFLDSMEISPYQAQALFTEMGRNRGIKTFCALEVNLSAANPKDIARGLSKLEEIQLPGNNLTDEQVQAIFTELQQNCKLKVLNLGYDNLSSVDAGDLATVIANIKVVDVSDTQLTTEQITAVLTRAQQNTQLQRLDITGNSISELDPNIVTTAREIIEEFYVDSEYDEESDENESLGGFSSSENDTASGTDA